MSDDATIKPVFSVSKTAAIFDTSRATVYRWISEGRLKAVKLTPGPRGAVRIPASEIRRMIQEGATR